MNERTEVNDVKQSDLTDLLYAEQAKFELWFSKKYTDHKLKRKQTLGGDVSCDYVDSRVQLAFEAWIERSGI